jgi:hypothetical protein
MLGLPVISLAAKKTTMKNLIPAIVVEQDYTNRNLQFIELANHHKLMHHSAIKSSTDSNKTESILISEAEKVSVGCA